MNRRSDDSAIILPCERRLGIGCGPPGRGERARSRRPRDGRVRAPAQNPHRGRSVALHAGLLPGRNGLALTAAWGAALGLASLSNVALLGRLRNMDGWLARLVGEALSAERPAAAHGRLIRLVDATTVAQAGAKVSGHQRLWRL